MRIKLTLGVWLLGITLAWLAVAPADFGVWPLVDAQDRLIGVWDVDSPQVARFDEDDRIGMQQLCEIFIASLR